MMEEIKTRIETAKEMFKNLNRILGNRTLSLKFHEL